MKSSILATFLGLAATTFAMSARAAASSDTAWNQITLCNDFHGGKPCVTYDAKTGCHNVTTTNAGYISSVKIPNADEYCKFYSAYGCGADSDYITVYSPGDVDLAVNYNFDNKVLSYSCEVYY